jgi:hypothetical protein
MGEIYQTSLNLERCGAIQLVPHWRQRDWAEKNPCHCDDTGWKIYRERLGDILSKLGNQWQAISPVSASPLDELPMARLEAFISAIRIAPVRLGPTPRLVARAGTKIREAKARPVPNSKEPVMGLGWITAICLLLMETSL